MKQDINHRALPARYGRPRETASRYRCGISTLYFWVKTRDGFPRPQKLGPRTTVFDWDAIDAYLASQAKG
jgi:predicted DNA-binding transcriptional regulator AlpA